MESEHGLTDEAIQQQVASMIKGNLGVLTPEFVELVTVACCDAATAQADEHWKTVVEAKDAEIAQLKSVTYCAYCSFECRVADGDTTAIQEHVRGCEHHPMRVLEARYAALVAVLVDYKKRGWGFPHPLLTALAAIQKEAE